MDLGEVALALRIISELAALIRRAVRDGEPVTRKEIAMAFNRAKAAEEDWAAANATAAKAESEGQGDGA